MLEEVALVDDQDGGSSSLCLFPGEGVGGLGDEGGGVEAGDSAEGGDDVVQDSADPDDGVGEVDGDVPGGVSAVVAGRIATVFPAPTSPVMTPMWCCSMHQVIRATASAWERWRCSIPGARSRPNGILVNPKYVCMSETLTAVQHLSCSGWACRAGELAGDLPGFVDRRRRLCRCRCRCRFRGGVGGQGVEVDGLPGAAVVLTGDQVEVVDAGRGRRCVDGFGSGLGVGMPGHGVRGGLPEGLPWCRTAMSVMSNGSNTNSTRRPVSDGSTW